MKFKYSPLWWIASILIVVSTACGSLATPTATSLPLGSPTATPIVPTPPANVYAPPFAAFKPIAVNMPTAFNGGDYTLPVDLAGVQYADQIQFSEVSISCSRRTDL